MELVGHDESEPPAGRIAFTAPLARALLNAEVGDEVDFAGCKEPLTVMSIQISAPEESAVLDASR
jgi:transcription elongation GreA/GreB family factor